MDRRELPLWRPGVRRGQDGPGRSDRGVLRPVPGAARGARADTGDRGRGPGRGCCEGAAGGGGHDEGRPTGDEPGMSDEGADAGGRFTVELPVFEGPFRLLADLILEQKVDVCDVSIGRVTDLFLSYSKQAENWTLEEATWFLAVCAVLLELKVGRLMPRPDVMDEEDMTSGRGMSLPTFSSSR